MPRRRRSKRKTRSRSTYAHHGPRDVMGRLLPRGTRKRTGRRRKRRSSRVARTVYYAATPKRHHRRHRRSGASAEVYKAIAEDFAPNAFVVNEKGNPTLSPMIKAQIPYVLKGKKREKAINAVNKRYARLNHEQQIGNAVIQALGNAYNPAPQLGMV